MDRLALVLQRFRRRPGFAVGVLLLLLLFAYAHHNTYSTTTTNSVAHVGFHNAQQDEDDHHGGPSRGAFENLRLNETACLATFPGLTDDIDAMVALGPFPVKQARDMGPLQAKLEDGQVTRILLVGFCKMALWPVALTPGSCTLSTKRAKTCCRVATSMFVLPPPPLSLLNASLTLHPNLP
ncbi:hypothetical protein SPI_04601 [Niveomyces insectorum RCEF 264]|uniref:Uncharacterized protein n=1 Tax=Niveomyces insectorum RCEF 264 TaxID=1081102 RepID=A0A167UND8_9HYPO|nr:hypothetical protein SPI_04601 [Niveomyces insectorum RCEF 264]